MRSTLLPVVLLSCLAACGTDATSESASGVDDIDATDGSSDGSLPDPTTDGGEEAEGDAPESDAGGPDADEPDTAVPDASESDSTPEPDVGDNCPDELFVVAAPDPANTEYPDPELAARCTETTLIVTSNAIIGYEYQAMTPNPLEAQDFEWEIPLIPTPLDAPVDVPLLGAVGFTRNGIPIYGPNEGPTPDPFGDPIHNAIVDWCLGHTGFDADYHYHAILAECVLQDEPDATGPSPILGFALDGYPIYGPRACADADCTEIIEMQSGWVQTGDPTTYAWDNHEYRGVDSPTVLDRCNGRVGPDGQYAYHATEGFPYVLGCYHGEANADSFGGGGGGGTDPVDPGDPPTPVSCTETAECEGTCGTDNCVCADTPRGQVCVPACTTAADCPTGGPTFECRAGTCVPARP
jgi:hypothetical protein